MNRVEQKFLGNEPTASRARPAAESPLRPTGDPPHPRCVHLCWQSPRKKVTNTHAPPWAGPGRGRSTGTAPLLGLGLGLGRCPGALSRRRIPAGREGAAPAAREAARCHSRRPRARRETAGGAPRAAGTGPGRAAARAAAARPHGGAAGPRSAARTPLRSRVLPPALPQRRRRGRAVAGLRVSPRRGERRVELNPRVLLPGLAAQLWFGGTIFRCQTGVSFSLVSVRPLRGHTEAPGVGPRLLTLTKV